MHVESDPRLSVPRAPFVAWRGEAWPPFGDRGRVPAIPDPRGAKSLERFRERVVAVGERLTGPRRTGHPFGSRIRMTGCLAANGRPQEGHEGLPRLGPQFQIDQQLRKRPGRWICPVASDDGGTGLFGEQQQVQKVPARSGTHRLQGAGHPALSLFRLHPVPTVRRVGERDVAMR